MSDETGSGDAKGKDPTEWNSDVPVDRVEGTGRNAGNAIQFRWWNLLLLVPLLMLFTPIFNKDEPRLWGMPVFYWFQFAFVFVGVAAVAIVFAATRSNPKRDTTATAERDGDV